MRVLDLKNLGYQDYPSRVAQVFYMPDAQSNLPPKKKTNHVVASRKQHIIGVDGVDDVEAYNNYDEMPLFNLSKDILPWERKGVKGKVVTAG